MSASVTPLTTPEQNEVEFPSSDVSVPKGFSWWWADLTVLGIWMAVAGFTLRYHEKWADEAQAWLLARDLDLKTLWFKELRYEGSPGLWHTMLWVAQHIFHAPYAALGVIGMACAAAGVALMLFKAPFPRPLRWLLAFTYVMVYQYAVIARPYVLLPLFCFAAAMLFKDLRHPERITLVLILLANLSFHGTLIAGCIGLAYLIEGIRSWRTLEQRDQGRYVLCIGAMVLTFLFLFFILKPTPDVEDFAVRQATSHLPQSAAVQQPSATRKFFAIISGAFFDHPLPSAMFLVLAGAWCFMRRKLLTFALPIALLIILYVFVHGYSHHHGTVFVAAITGLWIAWPTAEEQAVFTIKERQAKQGMMALLVCLFVFNIWDAAVAIRHEYLYPYSGAPDAAMYLKSVGADKKPIFGFLYGIVGVQAYFDHNILANIPTTYFHHGVPLVGTYLDLAELERVSPEYVVLFSEDPKLMLERAEPPLRMEGYELVHFSDGYMFNKRSVYVRQVYFIFRRAAP